MLSLINFYAVKDWVNVLGLVVIAFFASSSMIFNLSLVLLLIVCSLLLAFARSINNYFDAILEKEKNYIQTSIKKFGKNKALFLVGMPALISILLISIFVESTLAVAFSLIFIFLAYSYSSPPFRFRNRTFLDAPINILGAVSIFTFAFLVDGQLNLIFYFFLIYVAWYYFLSEFLHQLSDYNFDKKSNRITTCVKLGTKKFFKILRFSFVIPFLVSLIFIFIFYGNIFVILPIIFLVFNLLRFRKIFSRDLNQNFENVRTSIYGVHEGLLYILVLLFI